MRVTPVSLARAIAAGLGTVAWAVQPDRRHTLLANLERTAAGRTPREHRRLARQTFRNMALVAVDQFRLPSMSPADLKGLFEVRGIEHVHDAVRMGRGVLMITAHLGPYELAAAWMATTGYKVAGMVENLAPAVLDALASYRSATGLVLVNMKDGLRTAYRLLNEGYLLCLVADRAIGEARSAIEVPFLGSTRRLPIGPAVFAQATGAPILVGFATFNPAGHPRYLIEIDPPIVAQGRDTGERDRLVRAMASRMEEAIVRHPDQWFVFQPGWIERDGA